MAATKFKLRTKVQNVSESKLHQVIDSKYLISKKPGEFVHWFGTKQAREQYKLILEAAFPSATSELVGETVAEETKAPSTDEAE